MAQIFISYSSADEAVARDVLDTLREHGFGSVFLSADREDGIRPGEDWERRIYGQLRSCALVLPLLSPRWLASPWCHAELRIARCLGKKIFPVLVERCLTEGVAPELQHVDLQLGRDALATLGPRLQAQLGRRRARWTGGCPFPGLEAFDETHAGVFFGRDVDVERITERIRGIARAAPTGEGRRALVLSGASGVGKSSLMRAGIIADLRQHARGALLVLPVVRPRADLFTGLTASLAGQLAALEDRPLAPADVARVRAALAAPDPAAEVAALLADCALLGVAGDGILLPIDQGEELLGAAPAKVERQFALLTALMQQDMVPVTILATARSADAIALAARFGAEVAAVAPLSDEGWRDVIEGPLEAAGVDADEAFVDHVRRDAAGAADALPLVAHLMTRLWQQGDGFTAATYRASGGLAATVADAADELWHRHAANEEAASALRRAFVPLLASVGADGALVLGRLPVAAAPAAAEAGLRAFVERRLLRIGDDGGEPIYEAAHEALLRRWPRLAGWLAQAREGLLTVDALRAAAAAWAAAGRGDDYLDHRGDRLESAERVLADPELAAKVATMPGVGDYLDACRRAEAERCEAAARHRAELDARERRVAMTNSGLYAVAAQRANDAAAHDRALRLGLAGWVVARDGGISPPSALMAQLARAAFNDRLLHAYPGVAPASYQWLTADGRHLVGQAANGLHHRLSLDTGADERLDHLDGLRSVQPADGYGWIAIDEGGWLVRGEFGLTSEPARLIAIDRGARFALSPGARLLLVALPDGETALYDWPTCTERWRKALGQAEGALAVFDDGSSIMVPMSANDMPATAFVIDPNGEVSLGVAAPLVLEEAAADATGNLICLAGRKSEAIAVEPGEEMNNRRLPGLAIAIDTRDGEQRRWDYELGASDYGVALLPHDGRLTLCTNTGRLHPSPAVRLPIPAGGNQYLAVPRLGAFASIDPDGVRLWSPVASRTTMLAADRPQLPGFVRRGGQTHLLLGNGRGEEIDPSTGQEVAAWTGWSAYRSVEALRADGGTDAIGVGTDGTVRRLDGRTGEIRLLAETTGGGFETITVGGDGSILLVGPEQWRLIAAGGETLGAFGAPQVETVDGPASGTLLDGRHLDGQALVAAAVAEQCVIYDARSGEVVGAFAADDLVSAVLLPGERVLAIGRRRARVVSRNTGEVVGTSFDIDGGWDVAPPALSPDGRRLVLRGRLWDVDTGSVLAEIGHNRQDGARFSADGVWLAWDEENGGVVVADVRWFTLGDDALVSAICAEKLAGAGRWWPGDLAGTSLVDPPDDPVAAARAVLSAEKTRPEPHAA